MRAAFGDILVPGTPGFYVRAQHDPEKNKNIFFILKLKRFLSYHDIASIFDM